jgi:nucleoside-diphosphate-sugar epimerase
VISQSIAFIYAAEGEGLKDEDAPLREPAGRGDPAAAVQTLEAATLGTEGVEGVVLRYGYFYGPGTYFAPTGSTAHDVRRRRYPVLGSGDGVFSFIHVDDAAAATVAAVERGAPGVYNVVDDEPAPMREWLPAYAEAIGAKRPLRVPLWLAKRVGGPMVASAAELRGASNAKAKAELGWGPRHPSWRQGFRDALD